MSEQASLYWRRRMVAIGGVVIALVIVGWAAGGFFGEGSPPVAGTSGNVRDSQPPSSPSPAQSGGSGSATSPSPSPTPTTPATSATPPPDPNQPCPDSAMRVTVEVGTPQYKVGQRPELRLVLTNAGEVPCTRDVSRSLREVVVMTQDGVTRLWSSNDCYHSTLPPESQVVQAGEGLGYDVKWAGRTSAPGCPTKRTTVQAGTYSVIGRLGALTSPPVPIVLT
ncbi:hypothetical protein [Actinocrispum wychmicini]|uniref:Uncharacterized protein n=1 Tax=Actinocrispum wychmicini TaxID=1213861 RepID=A0A4R2JLP7_9PSEU|nr:hypothetical protein [Actinocrispum wychmicini]TCO58016.1 hypothetical protein EV192_10578 [Actinocrispum wychmicini]